MTLPENTLINGGYQDPSPEHVKANVAHAFISAFSGEFQAYCMLTGYEGLPD
jgi:hypothetical protein